MSNYVKEPSQAIQTTDRDVEWNIRDTEFLIRLIMSAKIDGSDIVSASAVITKIKALHSKLISQKVTM